jgi:FkbM family methyltransferase
MIMMAYNMNFLGGSSPRFGGSDTTSKVQVAGSDITSKVQQSRHPMEHVVKNLWIGPTPSPLKKAKLSCNMTEFVAAKSGKQSQICVHSFMEALTDFILRDKRWRDCNILPDLWVADGMEDDDSIYVDIGANIGSCVMEMLMSTKAKIIAFEPHPMNVFNLKKTVSKLGKEYQDCLLLFPVGLGDVKGNITIFSGHDNMGNSQLGTSIKDWGNQVFKEHLQFTVFVERMDALLDASAINKVRFVKMDCQGFECKAVEGMCALAEKIKVLKFENSIKFLRAQDCSDLLDRVKRLGFNVENHR